MSREIPDNGQWLEENQANFIRADEFARKIGEQNQLYSELVESGEVTIKPFQEVTAEYLTSEQTETFRALLEAQREAPYEELAERESQLHSALGGVAAQLTSIEERQKEEAALIHKEEELVAERIPELAPRLSEIASQLEQRLIAKARAGLESQQTALEAEYEALSQVYEIAGRAWPIPRLISTTQEQPTAEPETPEQPEDLIEVDDFPEETHLTKEQVAEKVRRKYPDEVLKDASEFVALFLAEEPKYIYTLDELADVLYGTDEENRKGRVSALVSNFELGKTNIIGHALLEQGLVFQRGERRSYHKSSGKPFGRCHPVFRAVPIDEAENKERIVHSDETVDWVNDGWHTVIFDTSKPRVGSNGAITLEYEEVSEAARENDSAIVESTSAENAGVSQKGPTTAPNVDTNEASVTAESERVPVPPVREVKKKPEPEWKQELRKDVGEVIAQFEADGLMIEGELSWKLVKIKSSSRALGTETMAERAINNRIISKAEGGVDSKLPVQKFICMALQNRYPAIFSDRSHRKQATSVVEQAVASYFERASSRRQ